MNVFKKRKRHIEENESLIFSQAHVMNKKLEKTMMKRLWEDYHSDNTNDKLMQYIKCKEAVHMGA